MFKLVEAVPDFAKIEENILKFWKKNKIFEKSIEQKPKDKPWTFLDGPPFVTGSPHYGSLLSSLPKDLFGRYWTMKGYRVRRVWGWDGHGLPIENKVEGELNIKRKRDIEEKVGIKKFIEECKKYVLQVSADWEWYVDHIGRWVDFKNAYKTWDTTYMESVMWVFKQMYDKGHVYKGLRVSLYCPHCATTISNFEVAMDADNYQEITEPANVYKYKLRGQNNTYLLAWSTTPWNKIVTPALALDPEFTYVKVKQGQENYILAESTLKMLKAEPYEIVEKFSGRDLIGLEFEPHFDFYTIEPGKKAFIVIAGDFVTADEGTGIVTIAAYGEEDLAVMKRDNIQIYLHVDDEGKLKPEVPRWGGMYYLDVNDKVNEDLKSRGLLYREDAYTHTVPTCWRCHTRLFYAPQDAWYINVQKLKPALEKTNEDVNWFPEPFKYGRYLNSLKAAPDWCISRSRYWGSPVPVWECEKCAERFVPESIEELEKWSGQKVADLHKPDIDEIIGKCVKCRGISRRVPEVLDSWIEAGSAPFAERHFPFEKRIKLEDFFPPDFIVEYTGQIRAWFYVLHVIAVGLYKSKAFKNVLVTGVILGTDGRKMSKNYGNYPDPKEMLQKYGGDALRLYLLGSPVMRGEDIRISEEEYRNQVRTFLLTLWNVYSFFIMYANIDGWDNSDQSPIKSSNILDSWILMRLNELQERITASLNFYDTVIAVVDLKKFVEDLSTWYIRRSRDRIGPTAINSEDKNAFYETCYHVLVTLAKLLAPLTPFIAEEMYRNLTGEESVHLEDWPKIADSVKRRADSKKLFREMLAAREVSARLHSLRKKHGIAVKIPFIKARYGGPFKLSDEIEELVKDETNVLGLEFERIELAFYTPGDPDLTKEDNLDRIAGQARDIVRQIQEARKQLGTSLDEKIIVTLPEWPRKHEDFIKTQTLASDLRVGPELHIERVK